MGFSCVIAKIDEAVLDFIGNLVLLAFVANIPQELERRSTVSNDLLVNIQLFTLGFSRRVMNVLLKNKFRGEIVELNVKRPEYCLSP